MPALNLDEGGGHCCFVSLAFPFSLDHLFLSTFDRFSRNKLPERNSSKDNRDTSLKYERRGRESNLERRIRLTKRIKSVCTHMKSDTEINVEVVEIGINEV